jgi:hypothetical protein
MPSTYTFRKQDDGSHMFSAQHGDLLAVLSPTGSADLDRAPWWNWTVMVCDGTVDQGRSQGFKAARADAALVLDSIAPAFTD